MTRPTRALLIAATAVFIAAFGVRLAYLHQIRDIGFFERPLSDGYIYDQRARGIAAGDWLGPPDFVHAPLYAYMLGALRVIGGDGVWWPRILQAAADALSCVLLLLILHRLSNLRVAILGAALLALYPPAIFFAGLIQKTSLTLLLSTLLLWLALRAAARPSLTQWLAAGVVLGLLILNQQFALVLVPLLLLWVWWSATATSLARRVTWLGVSTRGLVLTLYPWVLRNRVVLGDWVLTTPNLGQNFAMGNHPSATGTYLPQKRGRASAEREQAEWVQAAQHAVGHPLSAREVSDYYLSSALQWIRANPAAWLRLTAKKLLMTWNAYELPDTEDYYLYQESSPLLRGLDRAWHFGALAPLAAAGIVLTWSNRRRLWFLYGWLLLTTLAVAAFVVFARYRVALAPALLIFAALGVGEAVGRVRRRQGRQLVVPLAIAALVAVVANYPVYAQRRPYAFSYINHAVALADLARYDEAPSQLDRALALAPDDVDAHLVRGSILLDVGRFDDALREYRRAQSGDPNYAGAARGAGDALSGLGRFDDALTEYQHAVALDPADHVSLNCLATVYARLGRFNDAVALFQRVLTLAPDYPEVYLNLGNTYLMVGRLDDAATAYREALRRRPGYPDALHNLEAVEKQRPGR